jgi:hypothetical protein
MRWRILLSMACIVALASVVAVPDEAAAEADGPAGVCKPGVTNDSLMPLPPELVARARQVFELHMPDDLIQRTTVYRCMEGRTLLCTAGANLACGKADTGRSAPGVADWCRDHADADNVPMFVTGHDTIYGWRCSGETPVIAATVATLDARGFLSRNWKDAGK